MPQYRVFQVKDHRILFRCPDCHAKRSLAVSPNCRIKNVRCHRCGVISKCVLNRRLRHRQPQSGKATMILQGGRKVAIDLHDISPDGIGCSIDASMAPALSAMLSVKDEVRFSCTWNPDLFEQNRYIIKNIQGTRVSVQGETRISPDILL